MLDESQGGMNSEWEQMLTEGVDDVHSQNDGQRCGESLDDAGGAGRDGSPAMFHDRAMAFRSRAPSNITRRHPPGRF